MVEWGVKSREWEREGGTRLSFYAALSLSRNHLRVCGAESPDRSHFSGGKPLGGSQEVARMFIRRKRTRPRPPAFVLFVRDIPYLLSLAYYSMARRIRERRKGETSD